MEKLEFICKREQMLIDFIISQKPNLNFAIIKTALRKKDVRVNGQKVSQNILIKQNDVVTMFLPQKKKKNIDIVFEDENILIVSKPAGIETTKKDKAYIESDCLEDIFDGTYACHRLDKNTEGLIILAKTKKAFNQMQEVFKLNKIHKTYTALVTGKVKQNGDNLQDYLVKGDGIVKIHSSQVENSKIIKTNYVVKQNVDDLFVLSVDLLTGRTHQIRAHLAFHKIYVLGDQKYGDKIANKKYHAKMQLLCASKICFDNLPEIFKNLSNKTFEIKPSFSIFDYQNKF